MQIHEQDWASIKATQRSKDMTYVYKPGIPLGCWIQEIFFYDFNMVLDTIWRYEFDMLWIWGYFDMGFVTILIWFWYGFDMVPASWLQEKKQKQHGDRFLVDVSRIFMVLDRFLVDLSKVFVVLIWFWYDFDTLLIRLWHGFDTILIWFWYDFGIFWIWFRWVGFKSQVWPTSRIITETISKS